MRSIWFNDNISSISDVIKALISAGHSSDRIIVTSKNKLFSGFDLVSKRLVEAPAVNPSEYVEWALEFVETHNIGHFFVGRHAFEIMKNEDRFKSLGVNLLTSVNPDTWNSIDDKSLFYKHLEKTGNADMIPAWTTWSDDSKTNLLTLINSVIPESAGASACVKPVRGIFGQGYFRFDSFPDPVQQLFYPEEKVIVPTKFEALALNLNRKEGKTRNWMIMEYLPGSEFSVDALAYEGKIVAAIARRKNDSNAEGQTIVNNSEINRQMDVLAKEFNMSGAFNAQFKLNTKNEIKVLEINPRFSGGIGISLLAGINIPALWVQIADLGTTEGISIDKQKHGIHVYMKSEAVEITDHSDESI